MKTKAFFTLVMSAAIIVSAVIFAPKSNLESFTLLCAGAAMPQGSIQMLSDSFKPTEKTTVEATTKPAKKQVTQASVTASITDVPEDIKKLIDKSKIAFVNQKKDGDIVESTYNISDGNCSYQNVAVKNATETATVNVEKTLNEPINLKIDKSKPSVLIFHTHTTEGYEILDRNFYASDYVSRTEDITKSVVRVGTEIEKTLKAQGFNVIHDTKIYDSRYDGAYERSRVTVKKYLEKYPSLQVILDVHRDAIQTDDGTKYKPVNTIMGKKAAQIMLVTGCQEQGIEDYPNWYENLKFTLKLQKSCEDNFSGLMRPVSFCARRYNMHLAPCSILCEFGSDANTLDEAVYSGRLFAISLAKMLNKYV